MGKRGLIAAVLVLVSTLPASAQQRCPPFHEPSSVPLSVQVHGDAGSEVYSWPGIVRTTSSEEADLSWDTQTRQVYSGPSLEAENIGDVCAFAALISQRRVLQALRDIGGPRDFTMTTVPAADDLVYDGERVWTSVGPRRNPLLKHLTVFILQADGTVQKFFPYNSDEWGPIEPSRRKDMRARAGPPHGVDFNVAIATDHEPNKLREVIRTLTLQGGRPSANDARELVNAVRETVRGHVFSLGIVRRSILPPRKATQASGARKRFALVIGNSAYANARLQNPRNDARDMASIFRRQGFTLVGKHAQLDKNVREMERLLDATRDAVADADLVVVFYAGHGVQHNERNYLIPIDARLHDPSDLKDRTISLEEVLEATKGAKAAVVFLDACRRSPFKLVDRGGLVGANLAGGRERSSPPSDAAGVETDELDRGIGIVGLANEKGPDRSLVAYAAARNQAALDGAGRNSPYTKWLKTYIIRRDTEIRRVLELVSEASHDDPQFVVSNGDPQRPSYYSQLGAITVYFQSLPVAGAVRD